MQQNILAIGCIADDFTGASDAASFLVKGGLNTALFNGVPTAEDTVPEDTQAVVIALKTRTEKTDLAVQQSLDAARFLKNHGARQIYVKYCSTFDSTPTGNIGPICDAILQEFRVPFTVLCPSLPANGRTVKNGVLYVNGVPLSETHMRNHPLTPMWDSRISVLMKDQSFHSVQNCPSDFKGMDLNPEEPVYYVPDYETDEDGLKIVEAVGDSFLMTGGSGLLEHLARRAAQSSQTADNHIPENPGRAILVAGSCSVATRGQIRNYRENGGTTVEVSPSKLFHGEQTPESLWDAVRGSGEDVLFYSQDRIESEDPDPDAAERLEQAFAAIAKLAAADGCTNVICAGGETSGAVTRKLGFSSYLIGESIAPGVPLMVPVVDSKMRIVLKSGNFGQEDFFFRAIRMCRGC